MIIEEIINMSATGGWKPKFVEDLPFQIKFLNEFWIEIIRTTGYKDDKPILTTDRYNWCAVAADPNFWESLGRKVDKDYKDKNPHLGYFEEWDAFLFFMRFWKIVFIRGDIKSFWDNIIAGIRG